MQVTKLECLVVHPGWRKNLIFVRIETADGTVGWGEVYSQYDRDQAIAAQVQNLGQYLAGRNVFEIKHFCQIAFDDYSQRRSSLEFWCAISGIEQAMWDAVGKITKQPIYNLIGGQFEIKSEFMLMVGVIKSQILKNLLKKRKKLLLLALTQLN